MVEERPNGDLTVTRETKGLDLVRRDWCFFSTFKVEMADIPHEVITDFATCHVFDSI